MKFKSLFIFLFKWIVTLVPAWFVWKNIQDLPGLESAHFQTILSSLHGGWLLWALFALMLSHFLGAAQWRMLLVTQGVKMSYKEVARVYWVGLFFNNFMPGNIGGDLKRIYDIKAESGEKLGAGVSATVFDRLFGLFFLNALALAVGGLFFIWDPKHAPFLLPSLLVFIGFCLLFAALFSRRMGLFFESIVRKVLPSRFADRFIGLRDRFYLFRKVDLWWKILVLSAVTQSLRVMVHWFSGMSVGVVIAVSWYFYFIPIIAIVSALPISVGGFGPREFLAQTLFGRVGVGALESVVIQFLAYGVSLIISLFGAILFLKSAVIQFIKYAISFIGSLFKSTRSR